jgi:hypothetical protein
LGAENPVSMFADFTVVPELVFTKLNFLILYWISEIVIHSRVFVLDLPASIDV